MIRQKITIIKIRKPKPHINEELQWFGTSLGLFNLRDKDKSCFRIFIELLKNAKKEKPLTSDELAFKLNLSRGTVVHHLNKLREAGLVVYTNKGYALRVSNLKTLIDELERDLMRTCNDLKKIANDIDRKINLS